MPFTFYKTETKNLFFLSLPIIIGQMGLVLAGVADNIQVGALGSIYLSASNVAVSTFFAINSISFGVMFAISTLVSIKVGEKKIIETFITYRAGLIVAVVLFVFQAIVLEIICQNFHWFQQNAEVTKMVPNYLRLHYISGLPMLLALACRQFTDGLGKTHIASIITIITLAINVLLNWILINGHWGFPALGLNGAGWATLISRIIMLGLAIGANYLLPEIRLLRNHNDKLLDESIGILLNQKNKFQSAWQESKKIWKLGIPVAVQFFAEWGCFAICSIIVGNMDKSTHQSAAHTIALNIASVTYMIANGFAIAGSILVGNAYGEQNRYKIKRVGVSTIWLIVIFEIVTSAILILNGKSLAQLYGAEADIIPLIVKLLLLAALFQIADGVQAAGMSLLRGMKDVVFSSIISVFVYTIVSLPLGLLLGYSFKMDVFGIWWGFTIGLFGAAIISVWRFFVIFRKVSFTSTH